LIFEYETHETTIFEADISLILFSLFRSIPSSTTKHALSDVSISISAEIQSQMSQDMLGRLLIPTLMATIQAPFLNNLTGRAL